MGRLFFLYLQCFHNKSFIIALQAGKRLLSRSVEKGDLSFEYHQEEYMYGMGLFSSGWLV